MSDVSIAKLDATQVLTASVWPTGSTVRLLQVPWDSAYRDVVAWESKESRDAWFQNKSGAWYSSNFQNIRPGKPVAVPVPYSSVYKYNYLTVTNPAQPVTDEGPERTYFYFITSVEYLSPQATRLTVQLDVMTTYAGDITFGRAYVESGHVAMANTNLKTVDGGKPKNGGMLNRYLDLPEGVDCGNTLTPCKRDYYNLLPMNDEGTDAYIIIISTADLESDAGSVANPNLVCATGQETDGLVSGCNVYAMERKNFSQFMTNISTAPWVAQCIISMYAFPKQLTVSNVVEKTPVKIYQTEAFKMGSVFSRSAAFSGDVWTSVNVYDALAAGLEDDADLTKLYSYPYSVIELSTLTGNPVYLKPQFLRGNKVALKAMANALMPFAKAAVFPGNYGSDNNDSSALTFTCSAMCYSGESYFTSGDFLDTAVWVTDFPQFSIVNNSYLTYMASTAHTRAYQYESAGWQQSRGNLQASNAYVTAMNSANATQQMGERSANAQRVNAANAYTAGMSNLGVNTTAGYLSAGTSSALGVAGGLASGDAAGAVMGVASGLGGFISTRANQITTETSLGAARDASNVSTSAALLNAAQAGDTTRQNAGLDYNTALAINAGDYKNAVAGINATVQDAQLTPPSTSGQLGGNGFNWANGYVGVCVTFKTITGAARRAVADYFRRYGYAVKRFIDLGTVRDMLCMTHFAYWRVLESNITCAGANETEREAMRGIIEKGVTLWDAPESIGTVDVRDNHVRTDGKSYSY